MMLNTSHNISHNNYRALVSGYADLIMAESLQTPLRIDKAAEHKAHKLVANKLVAPKVLVFSPHPDDECIIGGLPLRLLRECDAHVINVAVTLGSNQQRQAERWTELNEACNHLGFTMLATDEHGLTDVNLATRSERPEQWATAVAVITDILTRQQPKIIFFPHDADWNRTHIGTHYLVRDALAKMPQGFQCLALETEFWGTMATPNLMIESSINDVTDLVTALSLHRGEVMRNAYHLRLPAWMIDNVRRGAELINGQGQTAPQFSFATLYRLRRWADGQLHRLQMTGQTVTQYESLGNALTLSL